MTVKEKSRSGGSSDCGSSLTFNTGVKWEPGVQTRKRGSGGRVPGRV